MESILPEVDNFDFIKDSDKLNKLTQANELLNINTLSHKRLIFIYSAPKVGSTSLVSSFRIFGIDKVSVIHIHDEEMIKVLANVKGVNVKEIILFNKYLKKDVYVINIYRSPIERKISMFFEKIGSYHFNAEDNIVNNYSVNKVINRFNNIFLWIANGDHFIDKYDIDIPDKFDFIKKYLLVVEDGIKFITLRLKDSQYWSSILTKLFGFNITVVKDYESSKKPIRNLYDNFKKSYKIPINFLNDIKIDKYLNYYYSELEVEDYLNEWKKKSSDEVKVGYTKDEYKLYDVISIENSVICGIEWNHYLDEGCICKACWLKRLESRNRISRGLEVERIIHKDAKTEFIKKGVNKVKTLTIRNRKNIKGKNMKLMVKI